MMDMEPFTILLRAWFEDAVDFEANCAADDQVEIEDALTPEEDRGPWKRALRFEPHDETTRWRRQGEALALARVLVVIEEGPYDIEKRAQELVDYTRERIEKRWDVEGR